MRPDIAVTFGKKLYNIKPVSWKHFQVNQLSLIPIYHFEEIANTVYFLSRSTNNSIAKPIEKNKTEFFLRSGFEHNIISQAVISLLFQTQ